MLMLILMTLIFIYVRSQWLRRGKNQRLIISTSIQAINNYIWHNGWRFFLHDLDCDFENFFGAWPSLKKKKIYNLVLKRQMVCDVLTLFAFFTRAILKGLLDYLYVFRLHNVHVLYCIPGSPNAYYILLV